MSSCLDEFLIEELACGELDTALRGDLKRHVDACPTCRQRVADAAANAKLFGKIRAAYREQPSLPPSDESEVEIAGYQILNEVARGGQGVVYRARQRATKRIVALKVLLQGAFASASQRRRFEREVDLGATLRHPNIVTLYDSGRDQGRQFFAMEWVDGEPLDQYAVGLREQFVSQHPSSTASLRGLLTLFEKVCSAVSYAHQRGIIHRDLKPGNILVDTAGVPRVLDFGLAKPSAGDRETYALQTRSGEFLGTLAYASPEQAQGRVDQIDIRTDVYSLGVVLYELLTQKLPHDVSGAMSTVLEHISHGEPERPGKLVRAIDAELETIVLKALAKEPARRYASAEHLRQDIANYLAGRPIDAKRDSPWYLLKKTVRRYRLYVALAATLFTGLCGALIVFWTLWSQEAFQRGRAEAATRTADAARRDENRQRRIADRMRGRAEEQSLIANLVAAGLAIELNDMASARERLLGCPEALRGWEWFHLWERLDQSQQEFLGHRSYVEQAVFSPDGKWVAAVAWDKTARIWNSQDGTVRLVIPLEGEGWTLAFHPRLDQLAVGAWNKSVTLYDLASGDQVAQFLGPVRRVTSLAFDASGKRLAASFRVHDEDRSLNAILIWDVEQRALLQRIPQSGVVETIAFGPSGERLYSAGSLGVQVWFPGGSKASIPVESTEGAKALAISPDGRQLAVTLGSTIGLFDLQDDYKLLRRLKGHSNAVYSVAFSNDSRRLVSGSRDKTVRLWDPVAGTLLSTWLGHTWSVTSVAFDPTDRRVVSASWDQTVKVWDAAGGSGLPHLVGHQQRVNGVAFSGDGRRMASASQDHSVKLWDPRTRALQHTLRGHTDAVQSVAFSPGGDLLASASWDNTVRVWRVHDGRLVHVLRGHTQRAHGVIFQGDDHLISGSMDDTVRIWDVTSGQEVAKLEGHDDHVHSVAINTAGDRLASAGHRSVRIWDLQSREALRVLPRSIYQEDFSLVFHPDGRRVAAGSSMRSLAMWDITSGQREWVMEGHTDEILAAAMSPDGRRLISASVDGTVKLIDAGSGKLLIDLRGQEGRTRCLAFSSDGTRIAGGLENGQIVFWESRRSAPADSSPDLPSSVSPQ